MVDAASSGPDKDGHECIRSPRRNRSGPVQVLGAITVALVLGAGGTVSLTSSAATSGARASTSASAQARTRNRDARAVAQRLARQGLRVDGRFSSDDDDCVAHSYGQVQRFFREHPCQALYRSLFEVRDRRGGLVLIAVAWVDMPDATSARAFRELVDVHGTGNITELNRDGGRYQAVRFTGEHYASTLEGSTVVNAQAEPVGRVATVTGWAEAAVDAGSRR